MIVEKVIKQASKTLKNHNIHSHELDAQLILSDIMKVKRGRILVNKLGIIEFIKKDLNNNDYLMIKASLATGFNDIVKDLKGLH